jgi:hypothetical protein
VLGLFVLVVQILAGRQPLSFRYSGTGLLLAMPVKVPPPALVAAIPPVASSLPGAFLACRGILLLACLLLWRLRLPLCLWLRILFCHNCQTD